ncbi:hypothetical protein NM688_g5917 [Phlebia brevispora]|uniref:Uncharacterized protein n=1 Tax=Phlebia brevispora TaxID=194682 RepID=A0ACC1SMP0_9APHY|nr:hypothetical protein NM688_g5917 [Phlebia brevispora]
MNDYKSEKEAFVSGATGSSIGQINLVSCVALASIALHSTLRTRLPANRTLHFPAEFFILAIPLLLSVTLFAETPVILICMILVPTAVLLLVPPSEPGTPLPSNHSHSRASSPPRSASVASDGSVRDALPSVPPLPALTTYRAHMLLLTFICILAVDFRVFPRSLAKCETFGVSMMDLGVGSFIFSQGIVSAIPLIKNPAYLQAPVLPKLITVLRKCLPLLVLGLIRTISVKGVDYPEHQTEYGTHWNFFYTIGLIPIFEVLLHPLVIYMPISLIGVLFAIAHQTALSAGGLMEYVLHAPRVGIISANKEGIVSLAGYIAIHLIGLSAGTIVLPPSPSYFRRIQATLKSSRSGAPRSDVSDQTYDSSDDETPSSRRSTRPQFRRENDKTATELFSYASIWWVFLGVMTLMKIGGGISRRVVNLPYIIWVSAFNTTFLLGYLVLDLVYFPSPLSRSVYSPTSKLKVQPDASLSHHDKRIRGPMVHRQPPYWKP